MQRFRPRLLWLAVASALPAHADNRITELEAPNVDIVATTPVPGVGTPLEQVPANVEVHTGRRIKQQGALELGEFLQDNVGSVTVNAAQNNPFQTDVTFRGLAASPLLGTPQGLSVFFDGVRVNEAFGDTVNWDLIPQSAISSINLMPGSNPVFGLNTLGGALVINTKSGAHYPGVRGEALAGSFGRKNLNFEAGGSEGHRDFFVTGNLFDETGWREHSPSTVQQLFAKVGQEDERSDMDLSVSFADNKLEGVQALPLSMMGNLRQAYTWPDRTHNRLAFFNLKGSRVVGEADVLAGNLYHRGLKSDGFNSNVNDDFDPTLPVGPGNHPAINDRSTIDQRGYGASLQWTRPGERNQLTVGLSADLGKTDFAQYSQEADFTPERGTVEASPFSQETGVTTRNRYWGLYLTDTYALDPKLHLTVSGRYNRARVEIEDRTGNDPALEGKHNFSHFNPAVGLTFNPRPGLTWFGAYNEGMRAPTPVELTCADPAAPCKLPNNFLADPPLKPVLSRTWEGGVRGRMGERVTFSGALYRTVLRDDIQFISAGGAAINAGFFQNVGDTRRQGIELGVGTSLGDLTLEARYGLTDATFRSPLVVHSPNNSAADASGDIGVAPGNRIPGIPRHTVKLRAEYAVDQNTALGLSLLASSSQYARGDENNADGRGQVPGYAVVNLDGRVKLDRSWELFGKVSNLFDRKYSNFGTLGENFFTGAGNTFDAANTVSEQFRSPGSKRGIWIGVRYAMGGDKGDKDKKP